MDKGLGLGAMCTTETPKEDLEEVVRRGILTLKKGTDIRFQRVRGCSLCPIGPYQLQ